ncbi:MAG: 2-isopropylmalate synthase, partial [Comamonadaceae bacterium]
GQGMNLELADAAGNVKAVVGSGNGPIAATVMALGMPLRIDSYEERSLGSGSDAMALAIVEAAMPGVPGSRFGVGRHSNLATASVLAVLSAAARFSEEISAVS